MISHVTLIKRDLTYDSRAQQAVLPVTVHHRDGSTEETLLMEPGQVELLHIQVERAIELRQKDRERTGVML